MRTLVFGLALGLALSGCSMQSGSEEEEPLKSGLSLTFSGFMTDQVCDSGDISMLLEDGEFENSYKGSIYYESVDHYRSTYSVEGELVDGVLTVVEKDQLEADELPPELQWCFGEYQFKLDDEGKPSQLSGGYQSEGCGCQASMNLKALDEISVSAKQ